MGEVFYTIAVGRDVIAHDVRAEYVPILVKGLLSEWFADYGLKLTIEAQERPYSVPAVNPNMET